MAKTNSIQNNTCTLEGVLFLPDHIQKALQGLAEYQTPADYAIPKGLDPKNEMSRYFQIAMSQWSVLKGVRDRKNYGEAGQLAETEYYVKEFLRDVLQYHVEAVAPVQIEERTFPLSLTASKLPLIFTAFTQGLDEATSAYAIEGGSGSKKSPFQLAQELVNASEKFKWALVTNGLRIRLLRDSTTLTRPSYLEFNLDDIFTNGRFGEFCQMWRVLHYTRSIEKDGECVWDQWVKQGAEDGKRARESLSHNVVNALLALGNGFVSNDKNSELRRKLDDGELSNEAFMRQLLRLMYRFIFLFCLEERDLLNTKNMDDAGVKARLRYARGYALHRFRESSLRRRFKNEYSDAWDSVRIVFRGLVDGEPRLALPALGGLFADEQCQDLMACSLSNAAFFNAMEELRWDTVNGQTYAIDYKNMGSEELGGVYESLLELVPNINTEQRFFAFVGLTVDGTDTGNARKMTSSYYTPDSLVQSLLNSALDPVIEERISKAKLAGEDAQEALLSMTVIDPAMGSGHFCLGAARRIAMRLASLRTYGATPTPEEFRHALRQVIERCIYGVDLNPLAVELARMALWLEGFEEGKPLSFLDHHLKVGNSLVGVFDFNMIHYGISKAGFKDKRGDDKDICKELNKLNTLGLKFLKSKKSNIQYLMGVKNTQSTLDFGAPVMPYMQGFEALESAETDTMDAVLKKKASYENLLNSQELQDKKDLCDLFIAGYMAPKNKTTNRFVPITQSIGQMLFPSEVPDVPGRASLDEQIAFARKVCKDASVFHWPIEFPVVMQNGGFSVVLGNPPWDKPKIEDEKWFATRYPEIAFAPKADVRKKMIARLALGRLAADKLPDADRHPDNKAEIKLFNQYVEALRTSDCIITFGHLKKEEGGRFPMTGVGDTNLYAYFAELASSLARKDGRVGMVIPTGIVTDNATQMFARYLLDGRLIRLYDFENKEKFFPIDSRYRFALVTMGETNEMDCVFYAQNFRDIEDPRRHIEFDPDDIKRMNPNTMTCPIMRSHRDMEINRKIYRNVPVLWNEGVNGKERNDWNIQFMRMFDMANDSGLFQDKYFEGAVPLYEAKLMHQYDDRYATFESINGHNLHERDVTDDEKADPSFEVTPRFYVDRAEVLKRLKDRGWSEKWVLAIRNIARATDERSMIATVLPSKWAQGHSLGCLLPNTNENDVSCLLALLNSIVVDYCLRLKLSGMNVSLFLVKQLPIKSPSNFTLEEKNFIVTRIAKLTRTNKAIENVWLTNSNVHSIWDTDARLKLCAEIDALIARLYGLNRSDLEFILDPSQAESIDYPSVTFPGLQRKEVSKYGEFRTRRLVLEAFDKLEQYGIEGFDTAPEATA